MRAAAAGDVAVAVECGCTDGAALVNALSLPAWRCPSCRQPARPGARYVLGPGGALPDHYRPPASRSAA